MVLAHIYKRDQELTWIRLASRFRDKVGRDVHPDVIEEKIIGGIRTGGRRQEKKDNKGRALNGWNGTWG